MYDQNLILSELKISLIYQLDRLVNYEKYKSASCESIKKNIVPLKSKPGNKVTSACYSYPSDCNR